MSVLRLLALLVFFVLSIALGSCAHGPVSPNDSDYRFLDAGRLLTCPPAEVRLSNTSREPWKLRGEGCGRVATFARICRKPGPFETAYVQSMPPPPAVAELERSYRMQSMFGNIGGQALAAWFMQSGRSREMKYGQGLADARMRDVERQPQSEYVPFESIVMMPDFWMLGNCRVVTYPTVFGKATKPPATTATSSIGALGTPYDEPPQAAEVLERTDLLHGHEGFAAGERRLR